MIFLPSRLVQIGCDCDAIQLLALGADPPEEKGVYLVNTIRGSSKSFPWSFFSFYQYRFLHALVSYLAPYDPGGRVVLLK